MLKYSEMAIFRVEYSDCLYSEKDSLKTTNSKITLPLPPGGEAVRKRRTDDER